MVKILANEFKKKVKKNPYLPVLIIVTLLLCGFLIKVSYDVFNEKESISKDYFGNEENAKFASIVDSKVVSTDPMVIQRIDSDFRPLLEKNFGITKFDRNFFIKSTLRENWHMFYFTKKSARSELFQQNIVSQIENLGYVKNNYKDVRSYEYHLDFHGSTYLVIFNMLSYNSDDVMGIYMVYVEKLK